MPFCIISHLIVINRVRIDPAIWEAPVWYSNTRQLHKTHTYGAFITLTPAEIQCIVMSVSVCLSVCPLAHLVQTSQNFVYKLTTDVARSSCDNNDSKLCTSGFLDYQPTCHPSRRRMPLSNAGAVQALHTVRVYSACRLWTSAFTATTGYGGKVTIVNCLVLELSIKNTLTGDCWVISHTKATTPLGVR